MAIKFGRPIEMRDAPRRDTATASPALDLAVRPRRNRKAEWARRLVRENVLTSDDLIWPLFLVDGHNQRASVASMPGVDRLSVDQAVRDAERAARLNIPCIALFPYTEASLRDERGSEALNADNLVCQAVRAIKKEFPDIGLLCDVALDPFTSHGHDGLIEDGKILNDETVAVLVRQALVQAEAGCDIIAPSDMMDGRVGAIRKALDAAGFLDVQIMAYAAKYASAFYGPGRDGKSRGIQARRCGRDPDLFCRPGRGKIEGAALSIEAPAGDRHTGKPIAKWARRVCAFAHASSAIARLDGGRKTGGASRAVR